MATKTEEIPPAPPKSQQRRAKRSRCYQQTERWLVETLAWTVMGTTVEFPMKRKKHKKSLKLKTVSNTPLQKISYVWWLFFPCQALKQRTNTAWTYTSVSHLTSFSISVYKFNTATPTTSWHQSAKFCAAPMDNSVMSMPDETNRSKHFQIFGHNFLNIPQFSLKNIWRGHNMFEGTQTKTNHSSPHAFWNTGIALLSPLRLKPALRS